jgi:ATP-dependent DNA helicase RecQ
VLRPVFAAGAVDAPVTSAMLDGCVRVLAQWDWAQRPTSVVAMPSRRRPELVDSLARGLAEIGRLPYAGALSLVDGGPAGEPGGSSAFRLAAVWQRFDASALSLPSGPVLLVDDLVDSRWTITIAARELRRVGVDAVLPFALALRG